MKKFNKVLSISLVIICFIFITACDKKESPSNNQPPFSIDKSVKQLNFNDDMNEKYINWYGRNKYDKNNSSIIIYNSAAGFEVNFSGTMLGMRYTGELIEKANLSGEGYIGVFADDNTDYVKSFTKLVATDKQSDFKLCEQLEEGEHTVKVLKCTEAAATVFSVYEIYTDGYFINPPKKSERKIEVYGDSITAGRASRKQIGGSENNTTQQENALLTYSLYAAREVNAQTSLMCYSGSSVGLYEGFPDSNPVANKFDCVSPIVEDKWEFNNYDADVVIIDLGTNDIIKASSQLNFNTEFSRQYKEFVVKVREKHPDAYIVLCSGTYSGNINFNAYFQIYEDIANSFNDGKVTTLKFNSCQLSHPSYLENIEYGNILVEHIRSITGWN